VWLLVQVARNIVEEHDLQVKHRLAICVVASSSGRNIVEEHDLQVKHRVAICVVASSSGQEHCGRT
jgi:hypothetical protein